jgi:hypothetical protein
MWSEGFESLRAGMFESLSVLRVLIKRIRK